MEEKTVAQIMHEGQMARLKIEDKIYELIATYEKEINLYDLNIDIDIDSDYYDNSLEVYLIGFPSYPWEPSLETRKGLYDFGFSIVYWNFSDDSIEHPIMHTEDYIEEIRGYEPRRFKVKAFSNNEYTYIEYGYVDYRFESIKEEWLKKYHKG